MCRAFFSSRWLVALILSFLILLPRNVGAQGISLNGEITYQDIDTKTTNKTTGESIKTDSYITQQRYNLDLSKNIYPYLRFDAATLFELNETTSKSEGTKTVFDQRLLQPLLQLSLINPIYQASLEYRRTELFSHTTNSPNTEDIRDEYDAIWGWKPVDLPEVTFRYSYDHIYDNLDTVDRIEKLFTVQSNYTAWRELNLRYFYSRTDTENRLTNFDTLEQSHSGRADYSHSFWDGRFFLNTNYRITYSTTDFSGDSSSAQIPLFRSLGLFSLDNTPQDGPALSVNNALIDGNLVASTGIDIGLAGDELTLTNIGLDLGSTTQVDEIFLWVDRRLTGSVANSFSWSIYTSPDNTDSSTWTLVATISPAPFGTFENRFQISFPSVNTRFIKVVTRPLDPAVPDAASFPNIFVTEMEAFGTVSEQALQETQENIDSTYDLNLTARVTDKTTLGYSFYYNYRNQDPVSNKRTELSNTISFNHIFDEMFSTNARLNRTDETDEDVDTVIYNYNLSLRSVYLPTFNQSLTFSGRSEKSDVDSSDTVTVLLRSNAILYSGWSAFVDAGFNWDRPQASDVTEKSILFRASTNFTPNQMLTINLEYLQREIIDPERDSRYDFTAEAFFVPFRALSLNARYNIVDRTGFDTRTTQNYALNFSPFPDGSLQFFFNYNETLESIEDTRQTTVGPGFNWTISNHFFFEMSYNYQKNDSNTQKIESQNLYAKLRFIF
ncbi:MAG: hypothetical protein LJE89_00735 [Deltaproteobacteria bacterium]|nr:hypothetical protein [Deltaproteobacteria bacterium]